MTQFLTWRSLGYLGLTPFVFTLILTTAGVTLPALSPPELFIAYSACILSFLAGTLWLTSLSTSTTAINTTTPNNATASTAPTAGSEALEFNAGKQATHKAASIFSNAIALLAFTCLLLPTPIALVMLALGFCLLLALEFKWQLFVNKPADYKMLRVILTAVVVSCHVAMFGLIGG